MRDIATTRRGFLQGTAALVVSFSIDRPQTVRAQAESPSKSHPGETLPHGFKITR